MLTVVQDVCDDRYAVHKPQKAAEGLQVVLADPEDAAQALCIQAALLLKQVRIRRGGEHVHQGVQGIIALFIDKGKQFISLSLMKKYPFNKTIIWGSVFLFDDL